MANGVIINSRHDTELYNECRESFHRSTEEPSFRRSRCRSTKNTTSHISASIVTDLEQTNTGTPTDITHCANTARRALTFLYHSPYYLSHCVNCAGIVSMKALNVAFGSLYETCVYVYIRHAIQAVYAAATELEECYLLPEGEHIGIGYAFVDLSLNSGSWRGSPRTPHINELVRWELHRHQLSRRSLTSSHCLFV